MTEAPASPLILGFVADLMFSTRIADVAERLGFAVQWIESAGQLASGDAAAAWQLFGAPASDESAPALEAALMEQVTRRRPALLIFDLANPGLPWRRWAALLKSDPATRRIPLLCYGSHKDVDAMQAAHNAGADAVLARSRFTSDLPALIQKYARLPDLAALAQDCDQALSPLARRGLAAFNAGQYFIAHEDLEAAWNADSGPGRELYRAILQAAVAYLQIERGNYRGAVKMFLRLRQWIDPLPDVCRGVDVAGLRRDVEAAYQELLARGPDDMAHFERRLLRPLRYQA